MITDVQATINAIVEAGGSLPSWIHNMPAHKMLRMVKAEARRCGFQPIPVRPAFGSVRGLAAV